MGFHHTENDWHSVQNTNLQTNAGQRSQTQTQLQKSD